MKRFIVVLAVAMLLVGTVLAQAGYVNNKIVMLRVDFSDAGCGMGPGAEMQFSNDGATWSPPEPFANVVDNWDLSTYGGGDGDGPKTVYTKVSDACGNWTDTIGPARIEIDWTPPTVIKFEIVDITEDSGSPSGPGDM